MVTKPKKPRAGATKRPLRLEWIEAGSLDANPHNWRRHPPGQVKALRAMLDEVDWAGALLYNERTQRLIDGHARKEAVHPKTPVPVLVGNWSEEQELQILATLDPIGAMAEADADALESLLAEADLAMDGIEELSGLLDSLAEDATRPEPPQNARGGDRPADGRRRGPRLTGFVLGGFHFEVPRQEYDAWLSGIEAKCGQDADAVTKELRRRLKI